MRLRFTPTRTSGHWYLKGKSVIWVIKPWKPVEYAWWYDVSDVWRYLNLLETTHDDKSDQHR